MNIRLLGTGGADGIPGLFSKDRVSENARKHRGRDVRTRSAALVDGVLKIDLPPDTLQQMHSNGLDASDWSALLFTHSHEDHFAVSEIQYALYPFTELELLPFQVFGNRTIRDEINQRYPEWPIDFIDLQAFQPRNHLNYRLTPIPAHHVPGEECFNLLIDNQAKFLYATDTGVWDEEVFEFLTGAQLDVLVIECTDGFRESDYDGHLNLRLLGGVLERLRKSGALKDATRIVTTHHSHTGNATQDELERALRPMAAEPGYDGLLITA